MADHVVFPTRGWLKPVRVPSSLVHVELHARTIVRHGHDAKLSQPHARHVVTWHGFSPLLFYF